MGITVTGKKQLPPGGNSYASHLTAEAVSGVKTTLIKHDGDKDYSLKGTQNYPNITKPQAIPTDQLHIIEVGGGMTINLGNFESAKIDVHIRIPCTKVDLDAAYEFGTDWVSAKLEEASKSIKS